MTRRAVGRSSMCAAHLPFTIATDESDVAPRSRSSATPEGECGNMTVGMGRRSCKPPTPRLPAFANPCPIRCLRFREPLRRHNLGTLASARLCHPRTHGANFLMILEAPPGFEPGMEVLQDCSGPRFWLQFADSLSNSTAGYRPDSARVRPGWLALRLALRWGIPMIGVPTRTFQACLQKVQ